LPWNLLNIFKFLILVLEWRKFDPVNDPEGPARDGVFMGYFHDGAAIYVGRGKNDYMYTVTPGRLTINGTLQPGVYTMAVDFETYDNQTAEYLVNFPNQTYDWLVASPIFDIDHNAEIQEAYFDFLISRLSMVDPTTNQYYTQALLSIGGYGSWAFDVFTDTYIELDSEVEMLMCKPNE
jgi:hypothetical protein